MATATRRKQSRAKAVAKKTTGRKHLVDNPKGKPIVDATEYVIIDVTAADVRKGVPMSPTSCAIAQGCKRQIKGIVNATINKAVSYIEYRDRIERFKTPERSARELIAFDRNAPFAPGQYYLRPPSKSEAMGRKQIREKRTSEDGSRGKLRQSPHITVMVRGA